MFLRVLAAIMCVPALAQVPVSQDAVICPRVEQAPTIDGALDDPCWADAAEVADFTRPLSGEPPAKPISVKLCFDDGALYLGFTCHEPQPDRIRTRAEDGSRRVWLDDCIEVWLRTAETQTGFDQFIVNAAGARQMVRSRTGARDQEGTLDWQAAAHVGEDAWTAELAIPFSLLGVETPAPGTLLQVKFGREDYTGDRHVLSTWPPQSSYGGTEGYGRLYFETANLLPNPDMAERREGAIARWSFSGEDAALFSSAQDEGRGVIRFAAPDRYAVAQQSLRLKPDTVYRLTARVRGEAGVYLRARTTLRPGEDSTPHTVTTRPADEYQPVELRFPSGHDGRALIILGNYQGLGAGEVFIADLSVAEDIAYEADGPAVPLRPGGLTIVRKLPVADCRALRGFIISPVDGRLFSYNWNMQVWEYGMGGAGAGVGYRYRNNDGLHITLADEGGVDAVQSRRGARVKLYRDAERYDDPGEAPLLWRFEGRARTSRALFPERVMSTRFSFFELEDGLIADVSFLRVDTVSDYPLPLPPWFHANGPGEAGALAPFMEQRFSADETVLALGEGEHVPFRAEPRRAFHLVSPPLPEETAVSSIMVRLTVPDAPQDCPLTVAVQDPLNPRQELMGVDFSPDFADPQAHGSLSFELNFPDQIIPAGTPLWLTFTFGAPVTVERLTVMPRRVLRWQALPDALAFRKLVMKGLFAILSEARQWTTLRRDTDLERFYRENRWGEGVRELAETIAQCKELGPDDDMVRVYDEWFWRTARDLPPFEPTIDDIPGAPQWAVLARQAWLTAREVPAWWLDNRLVPTGEFGGLVNDDTCMYQNYADFPMFEDDGVAARIKRGAEALSDLAEEENLDEGLNRRTMDPLHAYEEGINHNALLLWWNYGDPIWFERALASARSMSALTVVTERGHRHFKNQDLGAEDLRIERELGVDGHAHPLMLHPLFEVAWYNGNPWLLAFLREWADGWLEHQQPGAYATSVDVATETATATSDRPLYGGYGGQASAHTFLTRLTGDLRFIRPFMDFFERGEHVWPARQYVPELWHAGALDDIPQAEREAVLRGNRVSRAIALGDREALHEALRDDIAELQRFMFMYTDAEVFTDRVFLNAINNAAQVYTGGWATRNKYNHTHAASWEGFGTDYAALVLRARPDRFKTLIYNFRDEPLEGRVRLWTLDHGRYRLTLGPDNSGDENADEIAREETLTIARATPVALTLPPQTVMVLELEQLEGLEDIRARPDLAISSRTLTVADGVLTGTVHNIGGGDAPQFTVVLLAADGVERGRQTLGPLAAPVDLEPKRVEFRFDVGEADVRDWRVIVDPENEIAEIFEGNNEAVYGVR